MSVSAVLPAADFALPDVLQAVFDVSLTALHLLRPVYGADGAGIVDFTLDYLNPAGQRMTGLPERPGGTALTRFPHTLSGGVLDYYRRAFETGTAEPFALNYQADGLDNYYRLAARRSGGWLVVSFTDTADQPRTAVELALRESQAQEREARTQAEAQRQRLSEILMQLPASVAVHHGPEHVFTLVNERYRRLFPGRVLPGLGIREVLPGPAGAASVALLDQVYQTGEPYYADSVELRTNPDGNSESPLFLSVFLQALRDAQGRISGVLACSYDVTALVLTQRQVQQLNHDLETAVGLAQAAQARAERERNLLQAVLTQAPVAIGLFQGADCVVRMASAQLCAMWGYPPAQVLGRPLLAGVPELRGQDFTERLTEVMRTRVPHTGTEVATELRQPSGEVETRYFDFVYQPLSDATGALLGVLDIALDVTQQVLARRQVEALNERLEARVAERTRQLEGQQRLLQQIMGQVPAAIGALSGPTHKYIFFNDAHRALSGGRSQLGQPVAEVLAEVRTQGLIERLDQVYATGQPYTGTELPVQLNDPATGRPVQYYLDLTYLPLHDGQGQVTGILTFGLDVTERVLARREREQQAQQFRELYEHAPVAITILRGPEFIVELANPAILAIWGRTAEQALGRPRLELIPEASRASLRAILETPYRTHATHHVQEFPVVLGRTHTGQPDQGYFNFIYQPLFTADGEPVALTCVGIEVTEQVLARQHVQALNAELQAANQALSATNQQLTRTNVDLDNFIYTASHDLRAPISNIDGLLQALQAELPAAGRTGEVPIILRLMQQATERFRRTIGHLTDISRLQKEHAPTLTRVPLAQVVREVQLDLAPLLRETGGELTVDVPVAATLLFSEKNLRSVVYNLLSNALKYRHPARPPRVVVRYRAPAGAYQVLEVQDNGLGLDLAQSGAKLFAMFQRLHAHVEGTGIGLYMVKRMVENVGGYIEVQSELDVGSTFRIGLPS